MDKTAIQNQKPKSNIRVFIAIMALVSFFIGVSNPSLANDYLDELASEAQSTASINKSSQLSSTEKEQKKEMEDLLKSEKPSTFKYYVRLDKKKKERAYKAYADDQSDTKERLHHLQKKVMDLYFAQ